MEQMQAALEVGWGNMRIASWLSVLVTSGKLLKPCGLPFGLFQRYCMGTGQNGCS